MTVLAPVALFVFRRPTHATETVRTLLRCLDVERTEIHVYADGPRRASERADVEATRSAVSALLGDRATYHFSETNLGLSASILRGTGELLAGFGRAIVVEDDLVLEPQFLRFMNAALDRYADEPRVMHVSGYMVNEPELRLRDAPVFLPFSSSWGWATWARAWRSFDPQATGWEQLAEDRRLRLRFDLDGAYDYSGMLEAQMAGLKDSWAIRWYWSIFRADGLAVYPPESLVKNAGFDGSGTHGRGLFRRFRAAASRHQPARSLEELDFSRPPVLVHRDVALVRDAIRGQNGGAIGRGIDRMRRLVTSLLRA